MGRRNRTDGLVMEEKKHTKKARRSPARCARSMYSSGKVREGASGREGGAQIGGDGDVVP